MPTDPAILATVADAARRSPLATLVVHRGHLVNAAEWANTSPERLAIKVDEARAVLDAIATTPPTPPAPRFLAIYIGTTNDTNGNPRRGWYVYDLRPDGAPVSWVEEGYGNFPWPAVAAAVAAENGARGLPVPSLLALDYFKARDYARPYVRESGRIDVTPGEYRAARKLPRFGRSP